MSRLVKIAYEQGQLDALDAFGIKQAASLTQTGERMAEGLKGVIPSRTEFLSKFRPAAEAAKATEALPSAAQHTYAQQGHVPLSVPGHPQALPELPAARQGYDNFVDNQRVTMQGELGNWAHVPLERGRPLVPRDVRNMNIRKFVKVEPKPLPPGETYVDPRSFLEDIPAAHEVPPAHEIPAAEAAPAEPLGKLGSFRKLAAPPPGMSAGAFKKLVRSGEGVTQTATHAMPQGTFGAVADAAKTNPFTPLPKGFVPLAERQATPFTTGLAVRPVGLTPTSEANMAFAGIHKRIAPEARAAGLFGTGSREAMAEQASATAVKGAIPAAVRGEAVTQAAPVAAGAPSVRDRLRAQVSGQQRPPMTQTGSMPTVPQSPIPAARPAGTPPPIPAAARR